MSATSPPLHIPQQILDDMIAHARELDPFECCGLLAGKDRVATRLYRIKNIVSIDGTENCTYFDEAKIQRLQSLSAEERAEVAFFMDSTDFGNAQKDMRANRLELKVVYHSHTSSPARPSITDITVATEYERNWAIMNLAIPAYVIISLEDKASPDVRAFWIKDSQVTPTTIHRVP